MDQGTYFSCYLVVTELSRIVENVLRMKLILKRIRHVFHVSVASIRSPQHHDAVAPCVWEEGGTRANTETCCRFFRTAFISSDTSQYSTSLLRDLEVTSVIIWRRAWTGYLRYCLLSKRHVSLIMVFGTIGLRWYRILVSTWLHHSAEFVILYCEVSLARNVPRRW